MAFVVSWLRELGWTVPIVLMNDPENSTEQIQREVQKRRPYPTIPRNSPKESKGSLGQAEGGHTWVEGQARTMVIAARKRYPTVDLPIDD